MRPLYELVKELGSKSKAAEYLGVTRCTIAKYSSDYNMRYHVVIERNGQKQLFTKRGY